MEYFHGTTVAGLQELRPFASPYSNLKQPAVYLTNSRQLALHYIWDTARLPVKMPMLKICDDGTLIFQEMFSGALAYFYKGVSGYLYRCEADIPPDAAVGVPGCAASAVPVPVTGCEYIPDVYDAIMSYADAGRFIYERYETLPVWRIDVIRGHVMRLIAHWRLLEDAAQPLAVFVQNKFPRYWQEAQALAAAGLL